MDNRSIAAFFWDIAELLEFDGENPFRIRSYQRAAQMLENYPESIEDVFSSGGKEALEKIPGIGSSIATKIEEIIKHGRPAVLKELNKKVPHGLLDIMKVQGIGPKLAKLFFTRLKISNISELEKAAKSGKLKGLPGVEDRKVQNIIKGIEGLKARSSKYYIGDVLPYAELLLEKLEASKTCGKLLICGSLRRFKETIGDIDILATSKAPEKAIGFFTGLNQVKRVIAKGDTKSSVVLDNGMDCDLRVVSEEEFGSASHYFTGSKQHNIKMRQIAIKKGLKLSEYGVFCGKKRVAGKTEEDVFKALGLQFIPPEIREDAGEIGLAQNKKLPHLIGLRDIKGDFHVHSDYSDGSDTIEDIALAAKKLGYSFIAISDHSKSTRIANGLTEQRLLRQMDEIDRLNKKIKGIRILKGSEVDILPDGSLDFPDEILKKLDIVIGSVHSHFKMDKASMTKRIVRAMENKYLTVIGHPTGRLLSRRDPYEADIEKIIDAAKQYGKALELNAFPDRLDLNGLQCRLAKGRGVKIAIGTDSHSITHLSNMRFGVGTARRGWLGKKDVLNSYFLL